MSTELDCKYVCSRGLMKACDYHSNMPISSVCQVVGYDFTNLTDKSTIYICGNAIPHFLSILPHIRHSFILVSGDCDETMPDDRFQTVEQFHSFINDPRIIHWFCQNWVGDHPKVSILPIGMDYHTMSSRNTDWGLQLDPKSQENLLKSIPRKEFHQRKMMCYSNFHFFTTTRYGYDRLDAIKQIDRKLVFYEPHKIERIQTWKNQSEYAFVISPHGNGLDCHRTWEALCLGCIPIVKTSKIDGLYNELPVLIVKEWSDITLELLEKTVQEFKYKIFNYERLTLRYWIDKINRYKGVVPRLKNCKALFGLITKNVKKHISSVLQNVERYASYFKEYQVVIIDASSNEDGTYDLIQSWTALHPSIRKCYKQISFLPRPYALTEARNMYLSLLESQFGDDTYLIVMDCDEVNAQPMNEEGFLSNFKYSSWDAMFANQSGSYYDFYALRCDFCPNNYQHDPTIQIHNRHIRPTDDLIPVRSAFGGIGIYHTPKLIGCRYHMFEGYQNRIIETCEHVPFHYQLLRKGARLFINPAFINM